MRKLLLFWISCGLSIKQQILLSIRSSRNASQDRKQNSQTSQHTLLILSKEIYPPSWSLCISEEAVPRKINSTADTLVADQPFPRLHYGVRTTLCIYNTVYVKYGVHGLIRVCQSLSLAKYTFLTILTLILPAAPKRWQGAKTWTKPGGSDEAVHEVLGSTKLCPGALAGAQLLLEASNRSQTEQEKVEELLPVARACSASQAATLNWGWP